MKNLCNSSLSPLLATAAIILGVNVLVGVVTPPLNNSELSSLKKKVFLLGKEDSGSSMDAQTEMEVLYQEYSLQDDCTKPRDCDDVKCCGNWRSGVYKVYPHGVGRGRFVYCDLQTDGGWTVIQRRQDGSVSFVHKWLEYENGFGRLDGEFWLGLSTMHELTSQYPYELFIAMRDFAGGSIWAKYDWFFVSGPAEKYKLQIGHVTGPAGDDLRYYNGRMFSTIDEDNTLLSKNCAGGKHYRGIGWWFHESCISYSNVNGDYCGVAAKDKSNASCVYWYDWHKNSKPLLHLQMKVRAVNRQTWCSSKNQKD